MLCILEAFCINKHFPTPTFGIEAIARLIPIYLHIQKLNGRFQLRMHSLLLNHIIKSILETRPFIKANTHCLSLEGLMPKQYDHKFLLGNRLIDIFPNRFSFHSLDRKSKNNVKSHLHSLESVSLQL